MTNQGSRTNDESGSETRLNRRSVLSKAAIGATGFISVAGSAGAVETSAIPEKRKMIERFSDDADVKRAFADTGEDLVATLSAEGFVSVTDTSKLSKAVEQSGSTVGVVDDGGRLVTHLQTEFDVSDGTVTAVVHVETDRSYAFYEPHDTDEIALIDADAQESVGVESCYNAGTKCDLPSCDCYRCETIYEEVCCATGCEWRATDDCCTGG